MKCLRLLAVVPGLLLCGVASNVFAQGTVVPAAYLPQPLLVRSPAGPVPGATVGQQITPDSLITLRVQVIERTLATRYEQDADSSANADSPPKQALTAGGVLTQDETEGFLRECHENAACRILVDATLQVKPGKRGQFLSGGEIDLPAPDQGCAKQGDETSAPKLSHYVGTKIDATVTLPKPGFLHVALGTEYATLTDQINPETGLPGRQSCRVESTFDLQPGQSLRLAGLPAARAITEITYTGFAMKLPRSLRRPFGKVRQGIQELEYLILVTPVLADVPE